MGSERDRACSTVVTDRGCALKATGQAQPFTCYMHTRTRVRWCADLVCRGSCDTKVKQYAHESAEELVRLAQVKGVAAVGKVRRRVPYSSAQRVPNHVVCLHARRDDRDCDCVLRKSCGRSDEVAGRSFGVGAVRLQRSGWVGRFVARSDTHKVLG